MPGYDLYHGQFNFPADVDFQFFAVEKNKRLQDIALIKQISKNGEVVPHLQNSKINEHVLFLPSLVQSTLWAECNAQTDSSKIKEFEQLNYFKV